MSILPDKPPAAELQPPLPTSTTRANLARVIEAVARVASLAAVVLFFSLKVPNGIFFTASNIESILIQSAVYMMCGLGMTMIMISGGIDLAAGSTIAFSMVLTALVLKAGGDVTLDNGTVVHHAMAYHPFLWTTLAVVCGMLSAVGVGLIQGMLITGLRLVPFIVTLGVMLALRGFTKQIADNQEITPAQTNWLGAKLMFPVQGVGNFNWQIVPPGVWATLVAAILAAAMLRYTKLGRHIYAIGSNEATARLCGIPVMRTKITVYAIAGIFTGLAGVLEFSRLNMGQPTGAMSYELYVIAACVIGGTSLVGGVGTIFGTIIGALMIGTLYCGTELALWPKYTQEEVIGLTIIVAVALDGLRLRRE